LLDDDAIPSKTYVEDAFHAEYDIGQGILAPRIDYGTSLLSSVRDNTRTSDCIAICSYFNHHGNARIVHGEGLMVRANVENIIGWDYGNCLAEDLVFGRKATKQFKFGFINAYVEVAPPKTWKDFLVQRRRWLWGMISAMPYLDNSERAFLISRSLTTTFFGLASWPLIFYDVFFHIQVPFFFRLLFLVNTFAFISYELIGNWFNSHNLRRVAQHLLVLYPAALLEAVSTIYGLFTRPKSFEVIRK
jgi:cellulose synthase/poly-beta-1,6-N-acetylglucosamine synthase-like glycosyltransferase